MRDRPPRIYWDACCFIAILNNEPEAGRCVQILREARSGDIDLFISSLTMGEVVRPKGSAAPVPAEIRDKVLAFFENDYVRLINLDRSIVRKSLDYCWEQGLKARDALHLAAAASVSCSFFETIDPDLLRLGMIDGVTIRTPQGKGQAELFNVDVQSEDAEKP